MFNDGFFPISNILLIFYDMDANYQLIWIDDNKKPFYDYNWQSILDTECTNMFLPFICCLSAIIHFIMVSCTSIPVFPRAPVYSLMLIYYLRYCWFHPTKSIGNLTIFYVKKKFQINELWMCAEIPKYTNKHNENKTFEKRTRTSKKIDWFNENSMPSMWPVHSRKLLVLCCESIGNVAFLLLLLAMEYSSLFSWITTIWRST